MSTKALCSIENEPSSAAHWARWTTIAEQVKAGDPTGMEELYSVFCGGVRSHLLRQLGPQDVDDVVHDVFMAVVKEIRGGQLREPERLMGFVMTVVRRRVYLQIKQRMKIRNSEVDIDESTEANLPTIDPQWSAIENERRTIARQLLRSLPPRQREVLERFYLREEGHEQICAAMGLTYTTFRLLKSRAKARFVLTGRRMLNRGALTRRARAVA